MRKSIRHSIMMLISLMVFTSGILLSSCDNFMKSGDISREIKDAISYNNAAACTITLKAEQEMGEFVTGTQLTIREGYDTQFQFSLNQDDYIFNKFIAVCNTDSSISRADYVEFGEVQNDKKGIYTSTIRLLKYATDIVIRPVCIALPKIEEITPKSESGVCDQDTSIKIKFNKPVNPDTFFKDSVLPENRTIKDFKDISIYSEEEDLLDYFDTPYFSSDNKTLYIQLKQDKLILPPDQSRNFLNIKFAYNFENAKDSEGYSIIQNGLHEYKINKNYGNQKTVIVNIHSDSKYGTVLSGSEKECSVGYTIEVQYKPNLEDYKFTGFKAVSIKNDTVSRASAVSFENALLDEETGIYSVRIRVVEDADDLLILPLSYEYPKIVSYSPDSNTESYANTPIQVTFSIPMETSDTTAENTVFNYENILLTANGKSVTQYFNAPVFDSEKKVLTLPLNGRSLADYMDDSQLSTLTVNVSFTERILVTTDDVSVGLKDNGKTSFSVLYNKIVETVPPECMAFEVTSQKITLQNATEVLNAKRKVMLADKVTLGGTVETFIDNKFTDKDVATGEGISAADYEKSVWQNLTNGTVYIYGCYSDAGSGVKSVTVIDQMTHDYDGTGLILDAVTTEYTEKSEKAQFETNNGITKFCIEHKLDPKNNGGSQDGAVSIKVLVRDACGNCSKQEKRTAIKVGKVRFGSISNGSGRCESIEKSSSEFIMDNQYRFDTVKHNASIKKVKCEIYDCVGDTRDSLIFGNVIFPVDSYSVVCEYTDKNNVNQHITLEPEIINGEYDTVCDWTHTLNVDSVAGMSVKFIITDALGNVQEYVRTFPGNDTNVNFRKNESNTVCLVLTDGSNKRIDKVNNSLNSVLIGKPVNGTQEYCWSYDSSSSYIKPGYEYRIYNTMWYGFTGEIQDIVFTSADYQDITLNPLSIKKKYIEKGSQEGYVVRVVELDDSWKDYDYIYAVEENDWKPWDYKDGILKKTYTADKCFAPVITQYAPGTPDYVSAYNNMADWLLCYGVKDKIRSPEYEWELPYITDQQTIDYDDIPATITSYSWGFRNKDTDHIKFFVEDTLSGPLYGKITVPDNKTSKVYATTQSPFEINLPVWEYMPMSGITYSIKYELKDKSATGNKTEGTLSSASLTPILNLDLLKANADGSYWLNLDTLWTPSYMNWELYVSRLGQSDNNVWQEAQEEDLIYDYLILDDNVILKDYYENELKKDVATVKEILALYGIPEESVGKPTINSYSFYLPTGYSDIQSYKTALISAGVPENAIKNSGNNIYFESFTLPANKTLSEFYNTLTSTTGSLKIPANAIILRLPIIDRELIPRNPNKVVLFTDKDLLTTSYNNSFVKITADIETGYDICSNSIYRYVGTPGSGDYDWIMQKSDTDNYLLVSSDAPVFVHTLVTRLPYETCKDWPVSEWEYFKENYNDKFFDFDSTDHYPRRYSIPLENIPAGSCYCVIAHFADNHIEKSKVFVKP